MEKEKRYRGVHFHTDTIRNAFERFLKIATPEGAQPGIHKELYISHGDEKWRYDDYEEFYSEYHKAPNNARIRSTPVLASNYSFCLDTYSDRTEICIQAKTKGEIESLFELFETAVSNSYLKSNMVSSRKDVKVFIGHGRSGAWRDLKDHLLDKHGYSVEAYEVGARAGHTIRDILEDMLSKSNFACLVMTSEDETADGQMRARQNVIHEIGLFQGKLGFSKAIVLLESGTENFSNIAGIQYISFSKNNIKETFGDVVATLRREFG